MKSAGVPHHALHWGGTTFNFDEDIPRLDGYINATSRTKQIVEQQHIDVMLSNHVGFDGTIAKLATMAGQPLAQNNSFVLGARRRWSAPLR